jgi:hypothetical protein
MRRIGLITIVIVVVLMAHQGVAAIPKIGQPASSDPADLNARIAALETQVAVLRSSSLPEPQTNWRSGGPFNILDPELTFGLGCHIRETDQNAGTYELQCVRLTAGQ